MARNSELIRQWEILRAIDGARKRIAIASLAREIFEIVSDTKRRYMRTIPASPRLEMLSMKAG